MKLRLHILLTICLASYINISAKTLQLAEIFNEGVVLQRNAKINIWGIDDPEKEITLTFQGKVQKTKANKDGKWITTISGLEQGGPFKMTVSNSDETINLEEVYVGEVWIAGGQSNMAFTLEKSENGKEHISQADNKNIRFVIVPQKYYEGHKVKGDMNWRTATTENVALMSGIAYFFAKELQEKLNVPVGIICCYKGGTAAEVWMDREVLISNPEHAPIVKSYESYFQEMGQDKYEQLYVEYEAQMIAFRDSIKQGYFTPNRPVEPMGEKNYKRPYGLYNTMVKRIIPYTAKGVIWYQGEANAGRSEQYQTLFPALIKEWRTDFHNPDMPFLFVQLANYDHPGYKSFTGPVWPELREAQLKTWKEVKNTSMVVTMDVGEKNDIHPIYKQQVGERLAFSALNTVYNYNIPYSGPVFKKAQFDNKKAVLTFDYVYGGLKSEGSLKGFTICGKDEVFVPAKAVIESNKVIVSSEKIENPIAVRYNWENWGDGNLTNTTGFPATPFRTDNFRLVTYGIKNMTY